MSVKPLTREEREDMLADEYDLTSPVAALAAIARWEATVRAEESGRKAAEERAGALERLIDYAMLLHEHGEAPPGYELATWGGWYRSVREFFGHERADDAKRGAA